MTPDFARIKAALAEARSLEGDARTAWLAELCARDPALHEEVAALLRHEHAELPELADLLRVLPRDVTADELALPRSVPDGPDREYLLVRKLGEGGFGEVFLARMQHGDLERFVAIKLLRSRLAADPAAVARLRDEARLLGTLRHPSIVTVLGLTHIDGRPGVVTEYVQGEDLAACIASPQPPGLRATLEIVERVAAALDAAFTTLGVVHRDIKPQNIRVGVHADVKLIDFGIARSDALTRDARTASRNLVGTVRYLAPERLVDEAAPIGPAADAFALGAVLFEATVGEQLFADLDLLPLVRLCGSPDALGVYLGERLARVEHDGLRGLLSEMLDPDPDRRPTAAVIADRCDELASQRPRREGLRFWCRSHTWPRDPVAPGPRQTRQRPWTSGLRAGLMSLGLAVVALAVWALDPLASDRPTEAPASVEPAPPPTNGQPGAPRRPEAPRRQARVIPERAPREAPTVAATEAVTAEVRPEATPDRREPERTSPPGPDVQRPPGPRPELPSGLPDGEELPEPDRVLPAPEPPNDDPSADVPPEPAPLRTIVLASVPPRARVVDATGEVLGTTPLQLSLPIGQHAFVLTQGDARRTIEVRVPLFGGARRYTWHVADARVTSTTGPR